MHKPGAYKEKTCDEHHTPMKILNLIHITVAQAFYSWALREINPMHPDLPRIMMRKMELADKSKRMFA